MFTTGEDGWRVFRECGEDFGDLGRHGQSLVDTLPLVKNAECVECGRRSWPGGSAAAVP